MKNKYLVFVAMGMELVGIMVASLFIGQKIDTYFNFKGLAMITLSMAGLVGWLYHIIILTKNISAQSGKE